MKNTGLVTECINGDVKVRFIKESACGGNCASCGACSSKPVEIIIKNTLGAKPGDKVEVESDTSHILLWAFSLYILPLIILIAAYLTMDNYFQGIIPEIFGIIMFLITFIPVRYFGNRMKNKAEMKRIVE